MPSKGKTGVLISCTDPRLADAVQLHHQVKSGLGVDLLIPLNRPGAVGLRNAGRFGNPQRIRYLGLVEDLRIHFEFHKPVAVAVASHHDCLGCPGDPEEQEQFAHLAAHAWKGELRRQFGFDGPVRPVVFELHPNPGWKAKFLD